MIVLNLYMRILPKGDKVCKCYSYLKMIAQTHLHVAFFTLNVHHLKDSIYI